jgi:tRNA threonylcarbamoyladenosine biosynthesis protein TsaB
VSRLLLIDTAGTAGTIALSEDECVIATAELPGRSASERLVAEVRGLMDAKGWRLGDLAAVVVVHGPGSFTGVRVGLSAAKGLCEAGGVPMVAVSRLAVLAAKCGRGVVHAVLDAGRGEFFYGGYEGGRCLREALLTGDEVRAAVGSGRAVACEEKVAEGLKGLDVVLVAEPRAESALGIALERVGRGVVDDVATIDANYLRRTDFEIKAKLEARAAGVEG